MVSEGDAKAILEDHNKRLEEEKEQEDKNREKEQLAKAQRALKAKEFTSGVKIGFTQMMNMPVNQPKVMCYICCYKDKLVSEMYAVIPGKTSFNHSTK